MNELNHIPLEEMLMMSFKAFDEGDSILGERYYKTFEQTIANAPEAKAPGVMDKGKAYFNPNAGKEAEITGKLTTEPAPINPPDLTIRKVTLKRPDNVPPNWTVPGL